MTIRARLPMLLVISLLGFLAFGATASAAPPIVKNGKIYACYKAKGKGKGTLRVVRGAKVRCPRKWRKVSWYAVPPKSAPGAPGPQGPQGERGLPGTAGNVVVEDLENKVSELLTKVESLESVVANLVGLEAAVSSLCTQASALTNQVNDVEEALGDLSLTTLLAVALDIPPLPGALPAYSCPTF